MRVKNVTKEPKYKPHTIEITLESQEEAEAFYCLFNYTNICHWLKDRGVTYEAIKQAINEGSPGGDCVYENQWDDFDKLIKECK